MVAGTAGMAALFFGLVTAVEMVLLYWAKRLVRRAAAHARDTDQDFDLGPEPSMLVGAAMAAYGLEFIAADGFAPDGHFAWWTVFIFAVGVPIWQRFAPRRSAPNRFPADGPYRPLVL